MMTQLIIRGDQRINPSSLDKVDKILELDSKGWLPWGISNHKDVVLDVRTVKKILKDYGRD